jgi:DNA-directed RNA polymerase subunit beta
MDVSPKQIVSVATALIPFLEHDDANRALMGANMQRQAVPLLRSTAPYIGTGVEARAARDAGDVLLAQDDGHRPRRRRHVDHVDYADGPEEEGHAPSRQVPPLEPGTCINQKPLVDIGDAVRRGDVLADGPSTAPG